MVLHIVLETSEIIHIFHISSTTLKLNTVWVNLNFLSQEQQYLSANLMSFLLHFITDKEEPLHVYLEQNDVMTVLHWEDSCRREER